MKGSVNTRMKSAKFFRNHNHYTTKFRKGRPSLRIPKWSERSRGKMRILQAFLGIVILLEVASEKDEGMSCFASAHCVKGDSDEKVFLQISPRPKCNSRSPVTKNTQIYRTGLKFNNSISKFLQDVNHFLAEKCPSCRRRNVPVVDNSLAGVIHCYAPVVCTVGRETEADFIQIRPFPICEDSKAEDQMFGEMDLLFNKSRDSAVRELEILLSENRKFCSSPKFREIIENLNKSFWQSFEERRKCFVPVVCDGREGAELNWKRYPDRDCKLSTAMLFSKTPDRILSLMMQDALKEIKKAVQANCKIPREKQTTKATSTQNDAVVSNTPAKKTDATDSGHITTTVTTDRDERFVTTGPLNHNLRSTKFESETTVTEAMKLTQTTNAGGFCDAQNNGKGIWTVVYTTANVSYNEAKRLCSSNNSEIAQIHNEHVYNNVMQTVRQKMTPLGIYYSHLWIGLEVDKIGNVTHPCTNAYTKWFPDYPQSLYWGDGVVILFVASDPASSQGMATSHRSTRRHGVVCESKN